MAIEKKGAGEARQGPRPLHVAPHKAPSGEQGRPISRAAGIAPTFDAQAMRIASRAGSHKGMISNPWVKHWSGSGPAPEMREMPLAPGAHAAHEAHAQAASKASPKASGKSGVKREAGAAPKPRATRRP
jgi:hypothetical protein